MLRMKAWTNRKLSELTLEEPSIRKTMSATVAFSHPGQEKGKVNNACAKIGVMEKRYKRVTLHYITSQNVVMNTTEATFLNSVLNPNSW